MKDRTYTFTKDGEQFETSNLMAFCREHGLQRRHLNEVVLGKRKSHHGFEYRERDQDWVENTLVLAEIVARSNAKSDPEYAALIQSRVDKVRRGGALRVEQGKNDRGEDTITMLD